MPVRPPENSKYFSTEYSGARGFMAKLELNTERIKRIVVPAILREGCMVNLASADKYPLGVDARTRSRWIDPSKRRGAEIRPPDVQVCSPDFRMRNAEGMNRAYLEIKDFAQMNKTLSTGFWLYLVRNYIAVQHHMETPVAALFMDNTTNEQGNIEKGLMPYGSAFKDEGAFVPYGGLLFDMEIDYEGSFLASFRKHDDQVRWIAQRGRGLLNGDDGDPVMSPLSKLIGSFRNGSVKKVRGDPKDLPLWRLVQQESARFGYEQMSEPAGGLVYFVTES